MVLSRHKVFAVEECQGRWESWKELTSFLSFFLSFLSGRRYSSSCLGSRVRMRILFMSPGSSIFWSSKAVEYWNGFEARGKSFFLE